MVKWGLDLKNIETRRKETMANHQTKTANLPTEAPKPDTRDEYVRRLIAALEDEMQNFIETEGIGENLTGTQRKRLFSAGVRNYGFIDKAFDIARDNPEFMPPHFSVEKLYENLRDLEDFRQCMLVLQQFLQIVTNAFMLQADSCYRDALRIYGSLQEQTRNRVPGAEPLFEALRTFFHRRRRHGEEPTEMELERDFKKLIHGKADGEIIIKNETPHQTGGVHEVIDHVHTGRSAFKAIAEESEKE